MSRYDELDRYLMDNDTGYDINISRSREKSTGILSRSVSRVSSDFSQSLDMSTSILPTTSSKMIAKYISEHDAYRKFRIHQIREMKSAFLIDCDSCITLQKKTVDDNFESHSIEWDQATHPSDPRRNIDRQRPETSVLNSINQSNLSDLLGLSNLRETDKIGPSKNLSSKKS